MAKTKKAKKEDNVDLTPKPEKVTEEQLTLVQNELQEQYGTNDVNIQDGSINYPKENGEADKKD